MDLWNDTHDKRWDEQVEVQEKEEDWRGEREQN